MSDDKPRDTYAENNSSGENANCPDNAPPLIVTIEPQTKSKYSYEAKTYRLERARYRIEKKTYRAAHWTMIFLIVYTGLTLIVAIASIISANGAKKAADTATDTFKLSFRPRVEVVSVGPYRESRNGVIDNHIEGGFLRVQVGYVDRGPFTARNVRVFVYDSVGTNPHKGTYSGKPQQFPQISPTGEQTPNTYLTSKNSYSPAELDGLIKGTLRATFSVLFIYDDDLGKQTHHAEYCDVFTLQPYNDICPWPVQND